MSADNTQAMQEALQAAIARMSPSPPAGAGEPKINLMEAAGPLLSMLPRLLQSAGGGEEVLDRLESIQKEDITSLREQVLLLRKQCHRMLKSQEQLLERVHDIQRQQVAASGAVLDLAQQMARITFLDHAPGEDHEDGFREVSGPAIDYRADSRSRRNGHARRHQHG